MTIPIVLERDAPIIDWGAYVAWCTATSNPEGATLTTRSDGLLHTTYGLLDVRGAATAAAADQCVCNGVHLIGPEEGTEFTPYAISCVGFSADPAGRPFLWMGESPATITSDAGGDAVTQARFLGFGGPSAGQLRSEVTIMVAEGTSGRGLCVGVGVIANASGTTLLQAGFRLCVRRLVEPGPRVIDTRKL